MKALSPISFYDQVLDETLIKQYINGDNDALTEIFIRHSSRMKSIAYRITRNPQDADDVVQNSLISIMKNAHKFRGDAKLTTWIYRIVSNAAIDKIRSTKNQKSIDFINDFSKLNTFRENLMLSIVTGQFQMCFWCINFTNLKLIFITI